ncbi:DUF3489 domain-containing protein [Hydrogenophaga sp. T2]|uniref:DUF3489 domain-containing protein n=1 Tax=Hydrogenophaga sp. T2 TaxID=3132823 RepID=UPI003CEBDC44
MKRALSKTSKPASKAPAKASPKAAAKTPSKPKAPQASATRRSPAKSARPAAKRAPQKLTPTPVAAPPTGTKKSQLIALLSSGASMAQMTELTGWLPHTVRGMLSGSLRKRLGLNVQHSLQDGVRVYRIVPAGEAVAQ